MDLRPSDDQRLIADAAANFLAEACDAHAMRAVADSVDGFDRRLWQRIAELGWCGVQAPLDDGGLGMGWVEVALLQEQLGRRLACVPYFDSVVLAACVLRAAGLAGAGLLGEVVAGARVAIVAFDADASRVQREADSGWRLDGHWPQLPAAGWADDLLLCARDESSALLLLRVPAASVQVRPLQTIDATQRRAEVQAAGVKLPADACLLRGAALERALQRTRELGAIALAASQLGVAQQCLELAVAYAMQRVQFGQAIAGFQAVKHRCAQMLVAIEAARSAVHGAAAVADADPDKAALAFHAAQALCAATEAAQFAAQEALQLHGGVGFTWEYDVQLYFKRAQADSVRLGALSQWRERVAAQLLDDAP
ncbi:acyl-CoA dehydrogenase [Rhodanobacter glycinis]|uniref:Acyl-CoA dehydrogenase n=1 Tax=Rhodanobacter glycinis TaxID=582702 RepID=A0A5B9DVV6_9GAMM|nr:acyl-CoA dehydrogenase family protein [Rhodanobacter glycinis]QEE23378.1 acyl-CoA dehydrogenase [Rhodanobacter glycinis]